MSKKIIDSFQGEYRFLSNFFCAPVTIFGHTYMNNEAAFQAAKCPVRADEFTNLGPGDAKRLGRKVPLRGDWESVKKDIMYQIVRAKFEQNPGLKTKLLATGDAKLVEGNTWHDTIWGVCNGIGTNWLGEILMRVRSELRNQKELNDNDIIVLGGSFNPPTIAHRVLLQTALDHTGAGHGVFVPSSHAYVSRKVHRHGYPYLFTEAQRLEMLQAITASDSRLSIDTCEYGDDGRGYTHETLVKVQEKYPDGTICLLTGADKLNIMPRWRNFPNLIKQFKVVITARDQDDPELLIRKNCPEYHDRFIILPLSVGLSDISSGEFQSLFAQKNPAAEAYLDKEVFKLVTKYTEEKG